MRTLPRRKQDDDNEGVGCALIVVLLAILVACTFAYRSCENPDSNNQPPNLGDQS